VNTQEFIAAALKEDIGTGDYSTLAAIDANAKGKAILKIKEDGILAGMELAQQIFHHLEPEAQFTLYKKDGDKVAKGETAFDVSAKVHTILQAERLTLNCMQRMSGIATITNQYVEKIKDYLTIVAMDIIMFDLVFSTSAYQPTYGIAAHSLVLLCACFVSIGWYSLALSIAQDKKLRQTIRDKVRDESKLLDNIGTAQMEQEAQNKVMKIVREYEQSMKEQSGIPSSMQDNDIRVYMEQILQEVKQRKV